MRHSLPVKTVSLRLPGLWPMMSSSPSWPVADNLDSIFVMGILKNLTISRLERPHGLGWTHQHLRHRRRLLAAGFIHSPPFAILLTRVMGISRSMLVPSYLALDPKSVRSIARPILGLYLALT